MAFVLDGAHINDVTFLNSGDPLAVNSITVDDSKTSKLNLWTSDYISKLYSGVFVAGTMEWTGCASNTRLPFYLTAYKPEQQEVYITPDKTAFKCPRNGVYNFTVSVTENNKSASGYSYYYIDLQTNATPLEVGLNYSIPGTLVLPVMGQRPMLLNAGDLVQISYFINEPCTVLSLASFIIEELL
jgi:hypothetical protein